MLFLSDRLTSASGSIGGTTFSHNRFGLYTRARRVPVNPNTAFQQSQRDAFASSSAEWRGLTNVSRAGWEAYAASTPSVNKLGQAINLSGQQWYVAINSLALRLGLASTPDAPLTPGKIAMGTPTVVIDASALTVAVSNVDAEAGSTVGLFIGDPVSPGVSFFAGPYQLRGASSVAASALAYAAQSGRNSLPYVAGQRIPYRLAGVDDGGTSPNLYKLTTVASGFATVVA